MKKYENQYQEIQELCDKITKKSLKFAKETTNPYFQDLEKVLSELREIDEFLQYIKS